MLFFLKGDIMKKKQNNTISRVETNKEMKEDPDFLTFGCGSDEDAYFQVIRDRRRINIRSGHPITGFNAKFARILANKLLSMCDKIEKK